MENWRLLEVETPDQAAMNLAIEEAIFIEKTRREVPPTLRFWRSKSAAVIGYSQNLEAEVNLDVCREKGIQVVRRFTGGGAVYHDLGNLNYSIAVEADYPLVRGLDIGESYEAFSSGVIEGLKELGVEVFFGPPSDLLVQGMKISGNAQSRKKGMIFHHGTLLVNVDLEVLTQVLNVPKEGLGNMKITSKKSPVRNLADEVDRYIGMNEVKEALKRGFEKALSVKLISGALTSQETKDAETLHAGKYSRKEWNFWRQT